MLLGLSIPEIEHVLDKIRETLDESGYVFLPRLRCELKTEEVAKEIGSVVSIAKALPNSNIPNIQTLEPREKCLNFSNQYSGTFGVDDFPYHTDLAHWKVPPRYLLLRCIIGSKTVSTNLISSNKIVGKLGESDLKRAVFRTRRKSPNVSPSLLPLIFKSEGICGLRWDSLFLVPMNDSARNMKHLLDNIDAEAVREKKLYLLNYGDSLLIDNWKMLHGRSSVPPTARNRQIERVYLSNIKRIES